MSPRRSVADARNTRSSIVTRGLALASVHGLEGLTIGRLAADLELSKSGILGHFGDKETLQLAVVGRAGDLFWQQIWEPVADLTPGRERLRAVCARWVGYLADPPLPGGCFFIGAATEFDDRPGPVRDAIVGYTRRWQRELRGELGRAPAGWPADPDPDQVIFELSGAMLALHNAIRLYHDPTAVTRATRLIDRLLPT